MVLKTGVYVKENWTGKGKKPAINTMIGKKPKIVDLRKEVLPEEKEIGKKLVNKVDTYRETAFLVGRYVGTSDQVADFRREIMGEIIERIYSKMTNDDSDFIFDIDPSDFQSIKKLKKIILKYKTQLDESRIPDKPATIELDGIPVEAGEGEFIGACYITSITSRYLVANWGDENGPGLSVIPFGKEEYVGGNDRGNMVRFVRFQDKCFDNKKYPS